MQEHVFSPQHINRIRSILENGEQIPGFSTQENTADEDDDTEPDNEKRNQLDQLKNFKTKSPIGVDPQTDKLGFYNQFLMQNNLMGQQQNQDTTINTTSSTATISNMNNKNEGENNGINSESFLNILRMQQLQQNTATGSNNIEDNNVTNTNGLENNLLLQINTDKAANSTSNNNEILQQLYNYSQMSGKLIK